MCACVRRTATGVRPCWLMKVRSGVSGAPESTKTAVPPRLSPTTYAFERYHGYKLLRISTGGRVPRQTRSGTTHAKPHGTHDNDPQGEMEQASRPRGGPNRDARLLVRGAAPAAPERQARDRRRHHGQEAARASVHLDAEAVREARR